MKTEQIPEMHLVDARVQTVDGPAVLAFYNSEANVTVFINPVPNDYGQYAAALVADHVKAIGDQGIADYVATAWRQLLPQSVFTVYVTEEVESYNGHATLEQLNCIVTIEGFGTSGASNVTH